MVTGWYWSGKDIIIWRTTVVQTSWFTQDGEDVSGSGYVVMARNHNHGAVARQIQRGGSRVRKMGKTERVDFGKIIHPLFCRIRKARMNGLWRFCKGV